MEKSSLGPEHVTKLTAYGISPDHAFCVTYRSGETILKEGMPIEHLLVVIDGTAKVCASAANGRDLLLCYYVSDGILGDVELMTGVYEATTTIIAITGFQCIALPLRMYSSDLKDNTAFLNYAGKELALKLLHSSHNYICTALHSGEERLCAYILQASHSRVFSETLTDVACLIGISYRHLFRILNQLCDNGVLEKAANGYRIVDEDGLQKIAGALSF